MMTIDRKGEVFELDFESDSGVDDNGVFIHIEMTTLKNLNLIQLNEIKEFIESLEDKLGKEMK